MKRFRILGILCLFMLAALSGCKGYVVGHSADLSKLVEGEGIIDPMRGTIKYDARFPGLTFTCSGLMETVHNTYAFGGLGNRLSGKFNCTDGRKGSAEMTVVEVGEAKGTGKDECGNVFQFQATIDEATFEELKEEYLRKIKASGREFIDKCEVQGETPAHTDPLV